MIVPVLFKGGIAVIHALAFISVANTLPHACPIATDILCTVGRTPPLRIKAPFPAGSVFSPAGGASIDADNGEILCMSAALRYPVQVYVSVPTDPQRFSNAPQLVPTPTPPDGGCP